MGTQASLESMGGPQQPLWDPQVHQVSSACSDSSFHCLRPVPRGTSGDWGRTGATALTPECHPDSPSLALPAPPLPLHKLGDLVWLSSRPQGGRRH